jgi:hypothetical protein
MNMKIIKILFCFLLLSSLLYGQNADSSIVDPVAANETVSDTLVGDIVTDQATVADTTVVESELQKIYYNLEYNTSTFDDLKAQWIITDPAMVRDLINKFIAFNNIRLNGKSVDKKFIKDLNNEIALGNVAVMLRKRYFDDEIEYFTFFSYNAEDSDNRDPLFDPIVDGFYLKSIIRKELYKELQDMAYFNINVTKEEFTNKYGYNYDIYFNVLNPKLMFWSTTSGNQNKYLVSIFGEWGNEFIHFPGWIFQQVFMGLDLTYYSKLPPDPRHYSYRIKLGTGLETSIPYEITVPEIPLVKNGTNFYANLSMATFNKNLFLDLELMMTARDYTVEEMGLSDSMKYNSIRNFYTLNFRAINLADMHDFGQLETSIGFATHDMNSYEYDPAQGGIVDLIPHKDFMDRFNHFINGSIGVTKDGGLIQHKIDLFVGYNFDKYGYFGIKLKVMVSNTFGFEVRTRTSFGLDNVPYIDWRMDNYLVFSPIFRINY